MNTIADSEYLKGLSDSATMQQIQSKNVASGLGNGLAVGMVGSALTKREELRRNYMLVFDKALSMGDCKSALEALQLANQL